LPPAAVAGLRQFGDLGVDRLVVIDEELEEDPRSAARRRAVGVVLDELGREHELVLVADRHLDIRALVGVVRKRDAEPPIERERGRSSISRTTMVNRGEVTRSG
jgi:hypothetical protein